MQNSYMSVVKDCCLFHKLRVKDVKMLLLDPTISVGTYLADSYLMRKSDRAHVLGILISGQAIAERRSDDGMMHMSRLTAADLFGAASLFHSDRSYVLDIRCISNCEAILIPEETLLQWFSENDQILRNYLNYLTGRIRFLNRRLDALSKNTVPAKLMSYFLSIQTDGMVRIKSYTELAQSLSLSRATLYRALDCLTEERKISRNGKTILLLEGENI